MIDLSYFPTADDWQTTPAEDAGFDTARLSKAVDFAQQQAATPWPEDLAAGLASGGDDSEPPPWNEVLGPTKPRGAPNGLLLRGGKIIAEWGDTRRVDMSFSIAKSYLAVLAGLAVDQGVIKDLNDKAGDYALDAGFEHPQNQTITWQHLLQQTSEWQGSLWDKPDLIDRHRQVGANNSDPNAPRKGSHRELQAPGQFWEYNDVRVNRLSLSLMQAFRQPLPEVLKEHLMDPIGATADWQWHGYRNSYFAIDDRVLASVPGGSHWGGGLWMSSRDHARFALLVQRNGHWQGRQLLPSSFLEALTTPCPLNANYGYLWWLNNDSLYPQAPRSSFFALGAGCSLLWIDRDLDLVVVLRWIDPAQISAVCGRFIDSLSTD